MTDNVQWHPDTWEDGVTKMQDRIRELEALVMTEMGGNVASAVSFTEQPLRRTRPKGKQQMESNERWEHQGEQQGQILSIHKGDQWLLDETAVCTYLNRDHEQARTPNDLEQDYDLDQENIGVVDHTWCADCGTEGLNRVLCKNCLSQRTTQGRTDKALAGLAREMRPYLDLVDFEGTRGIPGNGSPAAWAKRDREDAARDAVFADLLARYDAITRDAPSRGEQEVGT